MKNMKNMKKISVRMMLALITALMVSMVGGIVPAHAATPATRYCKDGRITRIGGLYFTGLKVWRDCRNSLSYNVTSGSAQLAKNQMIVNHGRYTPQRNIDKTTLHEMTHFVEWKSSPAQRAKMYKHLGIRSNGNYYAIQNDNYYYNSKTFSIAKWKKSPRERLAESVVRCVYGSPTFEGMNLVPRSQCKAFIKDFKSARDSAWKNTK